MNELTLNLDDEQVEYIGNDGEVVDAVAQVPLMNEELLI